VGEGCGCGAVRAPGASRELVILRLLYSCSCVRSCSWVCGGGWACSTAPPATGAACADPITRITISGPMIRAASRHASRPGPVRLRAVPRRRDSRHWSLLTGQTAPTCRVRPSSWRVGVAVARPIVRVGDRRYRVPRLPIGGGAAGCVNKTLTLCVWYRRDYSIRDLWLARVGRRGSPARPRNVHCSLSTCHITTKEPLPRAHGVS
jgi:hypothetical protein